MDDPEDSGDGRWSLVSVRGVVPFADVVGEEFHPVDIAVVAGVGVVLVTVFQVPIETRWTLAFSPREPTVLTAFAANYVHFTVPHLVSNLLMYLVVVLVGYPLALSNGDRRRFLAVLGLVFVVFPVPLSYLNSFVETATLVVGFSGLNMALFGFLFVEFSAFLDEHFTDSFGVENAPVFFFLVVGFVATRFAESTAGFAVMLVSLGLAVAYSLAFLLSYRPSLAGLREAHGRYGYFELLVAVVVIMVAFVPMSFPRNPVTDSGTITLTVHILGFSFGFVSVYAWVLVATPADPKEALPFEL